MESNVVPPETEKLTLRGEEWIRVRKRLNYGEQQAAFARRYKTDPLGRLQIDPLKSQSAMIVAYLYDWNQVDLAGELLVIKGKTPDEIDEALNQLDPDTVDLIDEVIDKHVKQLKAAREAQKKTASGAPESRPTSISPDAVTGDTNGSSSSTPTSERS